MYVIEPKMATNKKKADVCRATCPDTTCQALIAFQSIDPFVVCQMCGQAYNPRDVKDVIPLTDPTGPMMTAARTIVLYSNPYLRKDSETVKVNGLSNFHCKLLSPLFTEYGMDKTTMKAKPIREITNSTTFDCGKLSDRNFTICREHLNVAGYGRDMSGSESYLRDTLAIISAANGMKEALVPLHADGDGHCLVHAISRALTGRQLFWHPLRSQLKKHMQDNREQYQQLLTEFINTGEWNLIIEECDPNYVPEDAKEESRGLRNMHIFGLANILKRPILLFDSLSGMRSSGDYAAVFLPALLDPSECKTKTGELNPPICLAWSNGARGHFIPLVGIRGEKPPVIPASMIPNVWGVPPNLLATYMQLNNDKSVTIGGKLLQECYIAKLAKCMDELFLELHGVHPLLVCDKYQYSFKKHGGSNKMQEVVNYTRRTAHDHRLFRCVDCKALNVSPLAPEWLRPGNNGLLYNLALSKYGSLRHGMKYNFADYGLVCRYDSKKDSLVLHNMGVLLCIYCHSMRLRLVYPDGTVAYENGDPTMSRSFSARCDCGFKHFFSGKEYDSGPVMITVNLVWNSRRVIEVVPWFEHESDPHLNSNVYQVANEIIQKNFPGEFGSEKLIQSVVKQIMDASQKKTETPGTPPFKTVSDVDTGMEVDGNCPSSVRKINEMTDNSKVSEASGISSEMSSVVPPSPLAEETDKLNQQEERIEESKLTDVRVLDEAEVKKIQTDFEKQQHEYKLQKEREYHSQLRKNAANVFWKNTVTPGGSGLIQDDDYDEETNQPTTTTVRVGPGYSVLAPIPNPGRGRAAFRNLLQQNALKPGRRSREDDLKGDAEIAFESLGLGRGKKHLHRRD